MSKHKKSTSFMSRKNPGAKALYHDKQYRPKRIDGKKAGADTECPECLRPGPAPTIDYRCGILFCSRCGELGRPTGMFDNVKLDPSE